MRTAPRSGNLAQGPHLDLQAVGRHPPMRTRTRAPWPENSPPDHPPGVPSPVGDGSRPQLSGGEDDDTVRRARPREGSTSTGTGPRAVAATPPETEADSSTHGPKNRAKRPGRRTVDRLRGVVHLDTALVEHRHRVGHRQGLVLVVGDEERRRARRSRARAPRRAHRLPQRRVEGGEGLVEQHERRVGRRGPGQGDPLLLAARELVRPCGPRTPEPDELEDLGHPLATGAARPEAARRPRSPRRSGGGTERPPGAPAPPRGAPVEVKSRAGDEPSRIRISPGRGGRSRPPRAAGSSCPTPRAPAPP